jgi:predicted Zn-dependent protease with MMP-like domain
MAGGREEAAVARLDEALDALEGGDAETALAAARRGVAEARRGAPPELSADLRWVEGAALVELGAAAEAVTALDAALALDPDHLDARLERARALFELTRYAEAAEALGPLLEAAPDEADVQHLAGLVAERRGDGGAAERHLARARKLDPEAYPRPIRRSRDDFDARVEAALARIPEQVRRYLANVVITVEDLPEDEELRAGDPPLSPTILGLFRGAPWGEKSSMDPWSHFPSAIVLYQRNLERFARSEAELEEEIGVTLVHEVGHFLGLDEEELWARGLD